MKGINMDDWEYEDQTDMNNDGDTSVGSDYNGYTPGYNNPNLATDYGDSNNYYGDINTGGGNNYYNPTPEYNTEQSYPSYESGQEYPSYGASQQVPSSGGGTANNYAAVNPMQPATQPATSPQWMNTIAPALANIFAGKTGSMGKTLAAVAEGQQNKKNATLQQQIATNPALDPFGSQRSFYQQQAQQAVTNPYDSPIVKQQVAQIQRVQDMKDAAAGRRSNSVGSAPGVMAAQAQIAQAYQNQMAQQGGSNIAPASTQIAQALQSGANSNVQGYTSPLLAALGMSNQANANQNTITSQMSPAQQKAYYEFMAQQG
jgi:hypothetical protein